jgi:(p)ppGpp synthase/HD superfamily hydrolase
MSDLIERALMLASDAHGQQRRKASLVPGVPYLSHLLEVAGMVQSVGGSDEAVAAALLHDTLEDTSRTAEKLAEFMPPAVVSLVQECTEIGTSGPVKADWKTRKDAYIAHLSQVSAEALLISVADKLQSLRGLKHCVRVQGIEAYRQLVKSAPTVEEHRNLTLWFNEQVLTAAQRRLDILSAASERPLFKGIEALLADMDEIILWLYRRS